jgi:hypothetical protein
MKKVVKEVSLALGLASLWFASAFFAAGVWLPTAWAFQCGMINAILGTLVLYLVTRTEQGAKMFYEGPSNGGWLIVGLLWSIPGFFFILGIVWWGLRYLLQLLGYGKL